MDGASRRPAHANLAQAGGDVDGLQEATDTDVFDREGDPAHRESGESMLHPAAAELFAEAGKSATITAEQFLEWGALDKPDIFSAFLLYLPPRRRSVAITLASVKFEVSLMFIILLNFVIAVIETDFAAASEASVPNWIEAMNIVLLAVYTLEICLRVFVYHKYYFRTWWNVMDAGVVALDLLVHLLRNLIGNLPNLSILRTVRLIRLARVFRVTVLFPELNSMLQGLACAIKTVFWGIIVVLSFVVLFALVAVQLIHPINKELDHDGCHRCPRAYKTVWSSVCTILQQTIAGDSWGVVTLQVVEESPATLIFFLIVLFGINLVVINLILAVVVERATSAYQEEHQQVVKQQAMEKESQTKNAQVELLKMCSSMDKDRSGTLSLDELLEGYDNDCYFSNLLKSMDINRDEVAMLFGMFDKDGSGDVDYVEFVCELRKLKYNDARNLLIWILHDVKGLLVKTAPKQEDASQTPAAQEQPLAAKPSDGAAPGVDSEELVRLATMVVRAQRTCDFQAKLLDSLSASCRRLVHPRAEHASEG